jgi:hypothetical protein
LSLQNYGEKYRMSSLSVKWAVERIQEDRSDAPRRKQGRPFMEARDVCGSRCIKEGRQG